MTTPFDVWAEFSAVACGINEHAPPERDTGTPPAADRRPAADDAPGSDFAVRGSWAETGLFDQGWRWEHRVDDDRGLVGRPGKDKGVSASIGMITSKEKGWPLFYCWSTSVPEVVAQKTYNRFALFAALRHKGDYAAAAADLKARGYGKRTPEPRAVVGRPARPVGDTDPDSPPEDLRIYRWISELEHRPQNDRWLWDGYIGRGDVTLFSALWKTGKSTMLAHLIRAFDGRAEQFLGRAITPCRVLYVTEEHPEMWAERRDDLGIQGAVAMICRPFRGRPSPADWVAFIGRIIVLVNELRMDVVVFDTLSKLWPVREENDAGQVEDALVPLWGIVEAGVGTGLVLVHHHRKSGGGEFTGTRGSGGLPAFAEILVEFNRNSEERGDSKRVLTGGGRYKETPDKWLIELTPSGYVGHGDPDDPVNRVTVGPAAPAPWVAVAAGLIPDEPAGISANEITAALQAAGKGVRKADLTAWLDAGHAGGEFLCLKRRGRGGEYEFSRPTLSGAADAVPPPESGAGERRGNSVDPDGPRSPVT